MAVERPEHWWDHPWSAASLIAEARNRRYAPLFHWVQCRAAVAASIATEDSVFDRRAWPLPRHAYSERWQRTNVLRDPKRRRLPWHYSRVLAHYLCCWGNPHYRLTAPFPAEPLPKEAGDELDGEVYELLKSNGLEHFFVDAVHPILSGRREEFGAVLLNRVRTHDTATELGMSAGLPMEVAYELACDMVAKPLDAYTWGLCTKPAYRALSRLMGDPTLGGRLPDNWDERLIYPVTPLIKHIVTVAAKWIVPAPCDDFNFRDCVHCLTQLETYLSDYHQDHEDRT